VAVVRTGAGEVGHLLPHLEHLADPHLDVLARAAGQHGDAAAAELEGRASVGSTEHLGGHQLGVLGTDGAAQAGHLDVPQLRGRLVPGLAGGGPHQPGPEPVRPLRAEGERGMGHGHVQDDVAVAVQAAGGVAVDTAGQPHLAGPHLPRERRVPGVDADALDRCLHREAHDVPGQRGLEAEQQRVVGFERVRREAGDDAAFVAEGVPHVDEPLIAPTVAHEARLEGRLADLEVGDGAEDDLVTADGS
jgi:hypothetical protein